MGWNQEEYGNLRLAGGHMKSHPKSARRSKQESLLNTMNPDREFLGSNPQGNVLRRNQALNQQIQAKIPQDTPKKLKTLAHQVVSNTPWHKDPLAIAGTRMMPSLTAHEKNLESKRYPGKATGQGGLPVAPHKYQAFVNPSIHDAMRVHDDRRAVQTVRSMLSKRAENNRLILDRPFQ